MKSPRKQYPQNVPAPEAGPPARVKARHRSKHRGVTLLKPDPKQRSGWRARYADPDTGRSTKVTLDASLRTAEARADYCVRLAKRLAKRRLELEGGAARKTGTGLGEAVERYYTDHPHLRERTVEVYRVATAKLEAWAAGANVKLADDVTGPKLVAFASGLTKAPLKARVKGKRGATGETARPRSAASVNRDLRSCRTVLGYLRRLGLLPRLNADELTDGLKRLRGTHERMPFLKPGEIATLLDAALAHDAATFALTRAENAAGRSQPRGTKRHPQISPMVAAGLLSGMRFGELLDLKWEEVDLSARGDDGETVGEIHLTSATKTKHARTLGLEVSPGLLALLRALHAEGATGSVWRVSEGAANAAMRRLVAEFGAPAGAGWQALRRTCGTFLTNAPGIFGSASAFRSAKQLGHSVQVAEKHYAGLLRGIPRDARTLDAAMGIETQLTAIVSAASVKRA